MATGGNDGKGPRPADERDRGLLFGLSEDGEDAGEGPGASPGADEAPPGIAAALAGIDARLGRLEAALSEWDAELPADGGSEPGLSDGVARIVEAADRIVGAADTVAEIERTSGEAARFTHDTKEATAVLQAEAGKQIAGLREGRRDLEKAVADLNSRADGLKAREDALGERIAELRALWKSVSETSGKLAAEVRTLANNYWSWKDEAAAHRKDMASLSGALLQGDARMAESVSKNAAAQLEISSKTLGNVEKFSRENDRLLERMLREALGLIGERKAILLAPSAAAARVLEQETGARARTLQWFLTRYGDVGDARKTDNARREHEGSVLVLDESSMVSTAQMVLLMRISERLRIARLVLVGDRGQLRAVTAGDPFRALQDAGIATAGMDEIMRQRDPALKGVVERLQAGRPGEALGGLEEVYEVPHEGLAGTAARLWLELDPEKRAGTAILAPTHFIRVEIHRIARDGLAREGVLHGREIEIERFVKRHLTAAQRADVLNHEPGDYVIFHSRVPPLRVAEGDACRVERVDGDHVFLAHPSGRTVRIRPGDSWVRYRFAVYETARIRIRAGDRIRWTANDRKRGLVNGGEAVVSRIDSRRVRFDLGDGKTLSLPRDDPQLRHIDHAWSTTVHAAQGMTRDAAIGVLDTGHGRLSGQAALYVEASRARERFALVTDNRETLAEALKENDGAGMTAREAMGEDDDPSPGAPGAALGMLRELRDDWRALAAKAEADNVALSRMDDYARIVTGATALAEETDPARRSRGVRGRGAGPRRRDRRASARRARLRAADGHALPQTAPARMDGGGTWQVGVRTAGACRMVRRRRGAGGDRTPAAGEPGHCGPGRGGARAHRPELPARRCGTVPRGRRSPRGGSARGERRSARYGWGGAALGTGGGAEYRRPPRRGSPNGRGVERRLARPRSRAARGSTGSSARGGGPPPRDGAARLPRPHGPGRRDRSRRTRRSGGGDLGRVAGEGRQTPPRRSPDAGRGRGRQARRSGPHPARRRGRRARSGARCRRRSGRGVAAAPRGGVRRPRPPRRGRGPGGRLRSGRPSVMGRLSGPSPGRSATSRASLRRRRTSPTRRSPTTSASRSRPPPPHPSSKSAPGILGNAPSWKSRPASAESTPTGSKEYRHGGRDRRNSARPRAACWENRRSGGIAACFAATIPLRPPRSPGRYSPRTAARSAVRRRRARIRAVL